MERERPLQSVREADDLGKKLASLVQAGKCEEALSLLAPVLASRTTFRFLDRAGGELAACAFKPLNILLTGIAEGRSEGGWVIIGSSLAGHLERDMPGTLDSARRFIAASDVWYGADILGDRVPGKALVEDLSQALKLLESWIEDTDRWVRRSLGVAVHYWAKRTKGEAVYMADAKEILDFIRPLFFEWEMDAAKGAGWGLKTMGRYYPDLTAGWLAEQLKTSRPFRTIILRKAVTYLPEAEKLRLMKQHIG